MAPEETMEKLIKAEGEKREWTWINAVHNGFWMQGYVLHKKDLSDLDEPYVSMVKAAKKKELLARGL